MKTPLFNYQVALVDTFNIPSLLATVQSLPHIIKTRIQYQQQLQNKAVSIQGWLLLKLHLEALNLDADDYLNKIQFNAFGKPMFEQNKSNIYFNIAHAFQKVVFASTNTQPIGVDIELVSNIDETLIKTYFTNNEIDYVDAAEHRASAFFMLWTKKEALIKCLGLGLSALDLGDLEVINNQITLQHRQYHFYNIDVGNEYIGHVCVQMV